jgi:hypothetical protein
MNERKLIIESTAILKRWGVSGFDNQEEGKLGSAILTVYLAVANSNIALAKDVQDHLKKTGIEYVGKQDNKVQFRVMKDKMHSAAKLIKHVIQKTGSKVASMKGE